MSVTERRRTSARRESLLGDQPGAFATARFNGIAPMKARRVVDLVRGLPVDEARAILRFAPQSASETVYKVLESAIANAETTEGLPADDLVVSVCRVDEGPTMKRWRPRAQGRGRQRFIVGPSSTRHTETTRSSAGRPSVVSALAIAVSSTL
ncbi:hypothetical protein GCM10009576_099210 [Streptomyces rhizosphaericus]|uniref:Large ribosomal subunit protein uL22 n=1 Tax=Streptomyces rhizosphaericus TaxID=114699 RepID=A0ABN1TCT7_9ACTN